MPRRPRTAAEPAGSTPPLAEPSWAAVVDAALDAVVTMDDDGRVTSWNAEAVRIFGWTREEAIGHQLADLIIPEPVRPRHREGLQRFLATGEGPILGRRIRVAGLHRSGGEIPLELTVSPLRQGARWQFCAFIRDLSPSQQTEETLRATEHRLRTVIETEPECVKTLDLAGRLVEMNPAGLAMIDADSLAQVAGSQMLPLIVEEDRSAFAGLTRTVLEGGSGELEFGIVSLKGNRRRLRTRAVPLRHADGTIMGLLGITRDVTTDRRNERLREASYRISEAVHQTASLPELYRAIHGIINELMPARNCLIGLHDAESDVVSFPYFVDERDPTAPPRRAGRGLTEYVIRTGEPLLVDRAAAADLRRRGAAELIGTDAEYWLGVPLMAGGRAFGALVVQTYEPGRRYGEAERDLLRFVSDQVAMAILRKRAEAALRESEAGFRSLVARAGFGIFRATVDGRFLMVNPALVQMLGYQDEAEVLALDLPTRVYVSPAERRRVLESQRERPGSVQEALWVRRDGTRITVRITGRWVPETDGAGGWYESFVEDVTGRRAAEDRQRQAQRLEAIGRLAGGVAHDFNNLLTAIIGSAEMLLDGLPDDHPMRAEAVDVRAAGLRAAGLTRQLLAFSRRQTLQPRPLDLNTIVRGMDSLLRRLIGEHIDLRFDLHDPLPAVQADAGQIEQVITNLVVNAGDAMRDGGLLTVETASAELTAGHADETSVVQPGPYVALVVTDTGHGIEPETRAHIFEPFFTTKDVGAGTGLGLATVYGIVKQSGGYVFVESEPGRGSTFRVFLPAVSAAAQAPAAGAPTVQGGSETILLAEDEPLVRKLAVRILTDRGYTVLPAGGGSEALAAARAHAGPIHLLATDVVMPDMSGADLTRRLLHERPGVPVVFMSGYTDDAIGHHGVLESAVPFVQKPFTAQALLGAVRETLDRSRR